MPLLLLAAILAWRTHDYAGAWANRFTIARHIAAHAPEKPRALMNWGVMQVALGFPAAGRANFERAAQMTERPYIRAWDRRLMQRDLTQNLKALTQLEQMLRPQ